MIPTLKDINMPSLCTPWLLEPNPYINPVINLKTQFELSKTLLYTHKKKKQKDHTLFD